MAEYYLKTDRLSVGYNKQALIHDIDIGIGKGEIVVLIGPNGSGKSTILKSITRQLELISGRVQICDSELSKFSYKELAKKMAVVLTDRMKPELMTCHEIVATGRYPYTGRLGILTAEDERIVEEAMRSVHADDLGSRPFDAISDGQRQRVLLARAICQEPEIIILDEPTSFLDIRHKLELLAILRKMAGGKGITVIMSLHEVDLAQKVADKIVCVKGETIFKYGEPSEIFSEESIRDLYGLDKGSFDPMFGSIELPRPEGDPQILILGGCGSGIPIYRQLQREGIPFAAGILFTNDVDYRLSRLLAAENVTAKPFEAFTDSAVGRMLELVAVCREVWLPDLPIGSANARIREVISAAEKAGKLRKV